MRRQLISVAAFCITAVVLLVGCTKSSYQTGGRGSASGAYGSGPTADEKTTGYAVAMTQDSAFNPRTIQVPAGGTVMWTNVDPNRRHTVTPDKTGPNSDSSAPGGLAEGQTFTWTVPVDAMHGTKFYYHCRFHGKAGNGSSFGTGMVGLIVVQ